MCLFSLSACDDTKPTEQDAAPLPLGVALSGDTLTTADFRDQTILVCFWATWCGACRLAFADLDSIWTDLAPSGHFEVVAVSLDTIDGALEAYLQDKNYWFRVTRNDGTGSASVFNVRGIPTYFVLDGHGYIEWTRVGLQPVDSIEAAVRSLQP